MNPWALIGIFILGGLTFYLGYHASRSAHTTQDFLVARRIVRSKRNAAAVAGEYLSAASFLGIAGLILKIGIDALWYPIGFTAGYLGTLLFVAAPLRRSGAYTVPDFAEFRLGSPALRKFSTFVVLAITLLYLVPQLQASGLVFAQVFPVPDWLGPIIITAMVLFNVLSGGMRAITLVQSFQYWVKLLIIGFITFMLFGAFLLGRGLGSSPITPGDVPRFADNATVSIHTPVTLHVTEQIHVHVEGTAAGTPETVTNTNIWTPKEDHRVSSGTTLTFVKGEAVPSIAGLGQNNDSWSRLEAGGRGQFFVDISIVLSLFAGTMGLPHVLIRFYTNPDGKAARRTTVHVLLLLGVFYLFPTILGGLGRLYLPELLVTGKTDIAIVELPSKIVPQFLRSVFPSWLAGWAPDLLAQMLIGVVIAGALAAFLATISGLLVAASGVVSSHVLRSVKRQTTNDVQNFRIAAVICAFIPLIIAILLRPADLTIAVSMSFCLAASTLCPVLVLGIWWRRLTWVGAFIGMFVGGLAVFACIVVWIISLYTGKWAPEIFAQPAIITVPSAFVIMITASLATPKNLPVDVNSLMMRLHLPDKLLPSGDRVDELVGGRHRAD